MGSSKELYDLNRIYFESIYEGKVNAGLQAYLDKKKGKKTDDKEENGKDHGNGNGNGNGSKGSKPDFLDLDKDGNKKEPMKSAAKSKKGMKEEMTAPRMQKGAMAYDGPNKAASEAKDRIMAKAKARREAMKEGMATPEKGTGKYYKEGKPTAKQLEVRKQQEKNRQAANRGMMPEHHQTDENGKVIPHDNQIHSKDIQGYADAYKDVQEMSYGYMGGGMVKGYQGGGEVKKDTKKKGKKPVVHIDKPDRLVSMKIKESGVFTEEEIAKFLWIEFDDSIEENRQVAMNPEKHKDPDESDKPYSQRSKAARMRDPQRGINSPAFKKFMADRGM